MMQRYRSKPATVTAYQLSEYAILVHILDNEPLPGVTMTAHSVHPGRRELTGRTRQHVTTIQGQRVPVEPGEWIVQEADGVHYYPIADDVFRLKYELEADVLFRERQHQLT